MTLINRTTFTSQASVAIDSLFSSTYKSYLIVIEDIVSATASDDWLFQLRYSGTTQTSGYFGGSMYADRFSATPASVGSNNVSAFIIAENCRGNAAIWINNVGSSSQEAHFHGTALEYQSVKTHQFAGFAGTQTYTGILLKSGSTNITGAVAIYGLAI
jgi:hypothetical protein